MKNLLTATAIIEFGVGFAFFVFPSFPVKLLLGLSPNTPVESILAGVLGASLMALGVACWQLRPYWQNSLVKGLIWGLLVYNTGTVIILVYAALGLALSGIGLWPAVLLHLAMAVWCVIKLKNR